jgi:hypothetical protein
MHAAASTCWANQWLSAAGRIPSELRLSPAPCPLVMARHTPRAELCYNSTLPVSLPLLLQCSWPALLFQSPAPCPFKMHAIQRLRGVVITAPYLFIPSLC